MKTVAFCILLFIGPAKVFPQHVFIADSGDATFFSSAPLEDIKATCTQVNSMINALNGEIAFMIPIRGFRFAKMLMQEHFNEKYMESDKYPHATFKGVVNEKINPDKPGVYPLTATGKLSIHGVEREVTEKGEMKVEPGKLTLYTQMFVALKDYNITIPQLLFNNIADTVEVKISAVYRPFK